jgi:Protein of unknown function (DUF3990)
MAWSNGPLRLFHGTTGRFATSIQRGINLALGNPDADFGQGFYTTSNLAQAREHANGIFRKRNPLFRSGRYGEPDPECAAYVEYEVDLVSLAGLAHLAFVSPNQDWVAFVAHCRSRPPPAHMPGLRRNYDVVHGPLQSRYGPLPRDHDQISFHSQEAVKVLTFVQIVRGSPQL